MRRAIWMLAWVVLAAVRAGAEDTASASGSAAVHIIEGMWSELWKLPDALHGSYAISESFLCSRYGFTTWLKGFPVQEQDLLANRVVILANIPADAFISDHGRSDAWIEDYLAHGGGVLILGGNYSLGAGGNKGGTSFGDIRGTAIERILPVEVHAGDIDRASDNQPLALTPAKADPILDGIDWSDKPMTRFYHQVVPRGDAQVLLKAGDAPILITGTYKGGRIALWTATVQGEYPTGALEYWRWKEWPHLVRNITRYLARPGK